MKSIFKYPLEITTKQKIEIPAGAKVLTVQEQNGGLCLWAMVDVGEEEKFKLTIVICGTGNPISGGADEYMKYIDTVQIGGLVWHVFSL